MDTQYIFPVSSRGKFPDGLTFKLGKNEIGLVVKEGKLVELTILVPDLPRNGWPRITTDDTGMHDVNIVDNPSMPWDQLKFLVRTIEGGLSFWGLSEIDLEACTMRWIPASPDEDMALDLKEISYSKPANNHPEKPANVDMYVRTILAHYEFSHLEVPLAFYRRGKNAMSRGRFLDATFDYTFLLETMFANGKFRRQEVIASMLLSSELVEAIERLAGDDSALNFLRPAMREIIESKYMKQDTESVISAIVDLRGFIHHHTMRRKKMWHPAEHDDHEPDAVYLAQLCHSVLATPVIEILYRPENVTRFKELVVTTSSGETINWTPIDEADI